jgi:hypothetical protein
MSRFYWKIAQAPAQVNNNIIIGGARGHKSAPRAPHAAHTHMPETGLARCIFSIGMSRRALQRPVDV